MIKKFFLSQNLRNSCWIIGERIFRMLLSLAVGVLTARYLGPANYGTLNYTASFIAFFTNIAALSMNSVMMVKLINHPDREGEYLGSAILYRILASLLSSIIIACLIMILNPNDMLKLLLVLIQSGQLYFKAFEILDIWFQRRLQSKYVSMGKVIAALVVSGYKIFLLTSAKGVVWFALSNVLSDFVVAVVLIVFYQVEHGQRLCIRIRTGNELLRESYHFILPDIMSAVYSYLDRIMIGGLMGDIDVGFYSTATAVSTMWIFVPIALINSYKPTIMELKAKGDEKMYLLRLEQLVAVVFWLCAFFAIAVTIFGKLAIRILYGEAYLPAAQPLVLLVWAEAFGVTSLTRVIWILCEDKSKYVKYYVFIGAVLNCGLNYILISTFGIVGAAVATLVTQVTVCVIAPLFFRETRELTRLLLRGISLRWTKG